MLEILPQQDKLCQINKTKVTANQLSLFNITIKHNSGIKRKNYLRLPEELTLIFGFDL